MRVSDDSSDDISIMDMMRSRIGVNFFESLRRQRFLYEDKTETE